MKFFLDTEFIERPCTIDLISLGIVAEDGREFYAVNRDCNLDNASEWVIENVLKSMPEYRSITNTFKYGTMPNGSDYCFGGRKEIASAVWHFIAMEVPEFWGYYADYDWVVFCWLFGPMVKLPILWPKYCRDIRQEADRLGFDTIPIPDSGHHNALEDAKWAKAAFEWLSSC